MAVTHSRFGKVRNGLGFRPRPSAGVHRFRHGSRGRNAGFSLVEVVIAVGIVAFAFIPMLGLVPMGLNTSRQAIDTTIEAQIIQQMTGQAQQTDFSQLATLATSTVTCFDANGNVTSANSAIYKASFSPPVNTTLPGGSTTTRLDTMTIYILSTRTSGGMAAASVQDLINNPASKKYVIFVADNGL
jgi:uncharacterized protein (TIGR02598 family)